MNKPTPFGKTYKEYTEAIEKFELSKVQKIELGIVDDYNSRIDKSNNARKGASKSYNKALVGMETAAKEIQLAVNIATEVEKLSKELGVKSPIDLKKVKSKLSDFNKVVDSLRNAKV
jgi:hypothetical protein